MSEWVCVWDPTFLLIGIDLVLRLKIPPAALEVEVLVWNGLAAFVRSISQSASHC